MNSHNIHCVSINSPQQENQLATGHEHGSLLFHCSPRVDLWGLPPPLHTDLSSLFVSKTDRFKTDRLHIETDRFDSSVCPVLPYFFSVIAKSFRELPVFSRNCRTFSGSPVFHVIARVLPGSQYFQLISN
jgi:hypothetical protein